MKTKRFEGVIVTPGMQFHEVAAQVMGTETVDFLLKRELTTRTGKQLGYSEEDIEAGIEKLLNDINTMFDKTKSRISCEFEVLGKAPQAD